MQPDLRVDRLVLLHGSAHASLAGHVIADIADISPETRVEPHVIDFKNPWDFEEVYGKLLDFARAYPFDPAAEDYLVHLPLRADRGALCSGAAAADPSAAQGRGRRGRALDDHRSGPVAL
jgi:transcriptional regulatory protein RtcR